MFTHASEQHSAFRSIVPVVSKIPSWSTLTVNDAASPLLQDSLMNIMASGKPNIIGANAFESQVSMDLVNISMHLMNVVDDSAEAEVIQASSVLKKRRRRMNRHKHKKWLKKMKYRLKAEGRK